MFASRSPYQRNYLRVVAGINVLTNQGSGAQIRTIKKIKQHEHFNIRTFDNDVALLLLSSPLIFNDHIQPACTAHNVSHEHDLDFSNCFISGWGSAVYKGKGMDILQEAEVQLFDRSKCNQPSWYHGLITRNMICAGLESGASDACQGDSGGPLQCYSQREKRFYLVGVSSHGKQCGNPLKPGVYARISRYAGWVSSGQSEVSSARGLNTGPISAWFKATPTLLGCILSVIITHLC
ncbi:acrosin [Hippoglossus hippoglossus]|uniref:acrosin n=1 Tax=Hippoglossus hippoglossus TaxID=8267 RepID=UPI00148C3FA5|nr:acrosin [Hippoglossus hippoglossus]